MIRLLLLFLLPFASMWAEAPVAASLNAVPDGPTIILDPGHGGTDLGARGRAPYCEEKRLCLQTARLVRKYLHQLGYHVVLTRNNDAFIPLPRRVELAAQASGDLFVSIHYNSARSPKSSGIEVFFFDEKEDRTRTQASRKLADAILVRLIRRTSAISRGVKKGNFFVIRENTMPAVLVEGGFLSNPNERSQLRSREYQEKIARGIADGIDYFLKRRK